MSNLWSVFILTHAHASPPLIIALSIYKMILDYIKLSNNFKWKNMHN